MVFMVRLTPGTFLILLCVAQVSKAAESSSNIENQELFPTERNRETKSRLKDTSGIRVREITDEDVENKVKPFKFFRTNPENVTSIKLEKSESYSSTQEPNYGGSRIEGGRSVDIDIEKYISPDFYNAVYTPSISTNSKDHSSGQDSHAQYGTEGSRSTENFGQLTTPRTPYFDQKYKEMVESVNQKLEAESDVENLTHLPNHTSNNFIEDLDKSPNDTKIVYKTIEIIGMNKSEKAGGAHRDVVSETQTILSIERQHNETTTYDEKTPTEGFNELHKENLKYLMGEEYANEVKKQEDKHPSSLRTGFQLSTRKYGITKPPTDKNDAGIISNKIEIDTLKSLISSTTGRSLDETEILDSRIQSTESIIPKRGSMKFVDYQKIASTSIRSYQDDKEPEQIYQENQVIPIHVASPSTNFQITTPQSNKLNEQIEKTSASLSEEEKTTIKNVNISVRNNTIEPEEQQSTTVLIIVQPGEPRTPTTESNIFKETTVTIASTPRGFSLPIKYKTFSPTTEILATTVEEGESTMFVESTEMEETSTKEPVIELKESTTTGEKSLTEEVTKEKMSTVFFEIPEPTTIKSTSTRYITVTPTSVRTSNLDPSSTDLSTTLILSTYQPSIENNSTLDMESSTAKSLIEHPDERTSTESTEEITIKLEQTTARDLGFSDSINTTEESPPTTEIPFDSTAETTTFISTDEFTVSNMDKTVTARVLVDSTTTEESFITTDIHTPTLLKINTGSSTTKLAITNLGTDEKITTESTGISTAKLDETTLSELRFSKGMKFTEKSLIATEIMKDSTARTSFETTTSIAIDTLAPTNWDKRVPVLLETTTTGEQMTTIAGRIVSILKVSSKKDVEVTPTETLFPITEENITQDDKKTSMEISDKNQTTSLAENSNKMYLTTSEPKTTNEQITTDDADHSSELDEPSGTVVAIVISCVGGVCLIALACLLIVMRNRQNRFTYGQRCKPVSMDQYSVDSASIFSSVRRKGALRDSKRSYGNPAFEDPVCMSHPLNFPAISKFAANQEDVQAEFGDIPQIVARTSELPEGCETKNRFANVIPLPESRVFLTRMAGYPNSDYINANYVTGPKNIRKYYIACQAPMSNTVDDFWRMIWEQQCKVILMLTHLFENGSEKCFDYLPPSEVLDCHRLFGDYQVTLKKREVKEKYIISSIQLKNMVSNSWREVTHFWYMGWPEKGVPPESNSIIAFLIEARSYMKSVTMDKKLTLNADMNGTASVEVNPVVVHCSPGTGRTGTAITCDIAIREFEQTRQVDIPKIVYRIRRDRANAVQTKEQYAFIYKVIALYATKLAGGSLESI